MSAPPDKRTIKIDGRAVEYAVIGRGRPIVVFLNGAGPVDMDEWNDVLAGLNGAGTLVAYNRFGSGQSARTSQPQTGPRVVATLRNLLTALALAPPYILVGHSLGGLFANLYARTHPDEVAAAVLVDSSHPAQGRLMRKAFGGVLNDVVLQYYALTNRAKRSELVWAEHCKAQFDAAPPFPDIPLIVLSAGKRARRLAPDYVAEIERYQRDLASLSPQGRQVIATDSTHMIPTEAPGLVIEAVLNVIAKAKER